MGRQVRRVPPGWEHPKNDGGSFIPLREDSPAAWDLAAAKWAEGLCNDYRGGWEPKSQRDDMTYTEWAGERPDPAECMPEWQDAERTHYMMYEDTTEGTPISPAFASPEELAHWLAATGASAFGGMTASYEGWLRVANGGFAPSLIISDGAMSSGVDGLTEAGEVPNV